MLAKSDGEHAKHLDIVSVHVSMLLFVLSSNICVTENSHTLLLALLWTHSLVRIVLINCLKAERHYVFLVLNQKGCTLNLR